ncbi:MAG: RAD55 family ATPase [Ignisphaera sp.]|uniref:AAA family ATPase n=1 Tax=Ignisphaera aggregans TaxID=334771 RepID=A0A7J3MZ02_9CREN
MSVEKIVTGIKILDTLLPNGIPRNSFIVIAGPGGSGKSFLVINIAKQFLLRNEPAIYVTFDEDPLTVASITSSVGVDLYKYLGDKLFMIIDGYSFRIKDREGKIHVAVIEEVDPQNTEQVFYTVMQTVDRVNIRGRGVIVIDSLNEFLSYHEHYRVAEFIKNLRANIAKYRGILTLAILHTSTDKAKQLLTLVEHVADGIILAERVIKDNTVVKSVVIQRMKGAEHKLTRLEYTSIE